MKRSLTANESGMAIITALLVVALASGLMAGMFAALLANQRSHATDRDQSVAYAAAHAGLEKLTSGLAGLFATDFSPDKEEIWVIDDLPPAITGFEYKAPGSIVAGSGYEITFTPNPAAGDANGDPLAIADTDITTGPFEGFKGLVTPYVITVTAQSTTANSEVRLRRELQTVAVPVFQFGIFGEKSLGFHAGPSFDFGGRVHTNDRLYLASGAGTTLTFRDKITAFTEVVRTTLMNTIAITDTLHTGTVSLPTVIGGPPPTYLALTANPNQGSGTTAAPWSGWKLLSEETYHTNIRTEATGAKRLNLPLTSQGAAPIDLIKRPIVLLNEHTANAAVFGQRYFAQASLRILLSDRASDITGLPTITAAAPVDLSLLVTQVGDPPIPLSPGADLFDAAGAPRTRLTVAPGGQPATLTMENAATGAWLPGVPEWLRWTSITINGVAVPCYGMTATVLTDCVAHVAYANNAEITFTRPDASTFTAQVNGTFGAGNGDVNIDTFSTLQWNFVATRSFFVGEDVVTCTGFDSNVANVTNRLTGCTWPTPVGGSAINNGDPVYSGATTTPGTPLLHGFIKIERQDDDVDGVWTDVTMEILNLGFAGPNQQGALCADPTPDAVIRMIRLRDNGMAAANACTAAAPATDYHLSLAPTDFWPLTIFDARESTSRVATTGMNAGGVFSYVALDVSNFRRWVTTAIPGTGALSRENNGYIVYFSDRRGDHNELHATTPDIETGEYGFEDSINPSVAAWAVGMAGRGTLETGENFNENLTLETYGETPHALVAPVVGGFANMIAGMGFDGASRPWTNITQLYTGRGRLARPVLFRRALKLINAGLTGVNNLIPVQGFTVASENPVYVQGNFNASQLTANAGGGAANPWVLPNGLPNPISEPNRATAIIADTITLLSNAFNDSKTFQFPDNVAGRIATSTAYRFAMVTGKAVPFPKPGAWGVQEMGSDGGVHNFMRFLENWGGGPNVRYRGSMVSLFYSRQAVGIYRTDEVYGAPNRLYNFDSDFLEPALLPPGTPMFRDINTLKFRQILRPNQ